MTTTEQLAVQTIEVSMTQQPEAYTSVRRAITLQIFTRPDDDVIALTRAKMAEAVKIVEDSIDDDFERGHGASAKYSDEPRYDYIYWNKKKTIVIIPANLNEEEIPQGWHHLNKERRNDRLEFLKKYLKKRKDYKGFAILDCTQNFDEILKFPEIHHGAITYHRQQNIAILTPYGDKEPSEEFKQKYDEKWRWNRLYEINFYENILEWAEKIAQKENTTLYICWNGDLSQIPPPKTAEPEPENENDNEIEESIIL